MLAPVRQKLRERRSPKSLEPDKTNISYFVAILRFVAIYVFYKAQIRAKTTFCVAQKKKHFFSRKLAITLLTKELKAFFAFAENLPKCPLLPPSTYFHNRICAHFAKSVPDERHQRIL